MKILHYIPECMISSDNAETAFGSADISNSYLSVLTNTMAALAEVSIAKTLPQLKQQAKDMQPDIVHIHACWNFSAYMAQHWAMKRQLALVLSLHNGMQPWHVHHHFWLQKVPMLMIYQRHAIRSADAILVSSHSEQQRLKAMKWNSRLALVRNSTISNTITNQQMTEELLSFYQKVIDSNSFRLMTEEDRTNENLLLHAAVFGAEEAGIPEISLPSLRKILIHAQEEGILEEVKKGASLMHQNVESLVVEDMERFPRRLKKSIGALESDKPLPKSHISKSKLSNLKQDEKPDETESRLIMMLVNVHHELKHHKLSRRHLTDLFRELRFKEYDEDKLQRMTKQMGIQKFTSRLMQILHETFYLEEGYMPVPPVDDKRTDNIRKSLLNSNTQ